MIVIQNLLFSFVFANFHFLAMLQLFLESVFHLACRQNVCITIVMQIHQNIYRIYTDTAKPVLSKPV